MVFGFGLLSCKPRLRAGFHHASSVSGSGFKVCGFLGFADLVFGGLITLGC